MLFVVLTSLIARIAHGLPEIGVNCGRLEIQDHHHCRIQANNQVKIYLGPDKKVFEDPLFGLITYQCDGTAGYFMSNIDCEKCNFTCSEEEPTASCSVSQAGAAQLWWGVIFGAVSFILVVGIVWRKFPVAFKTSSSFNFGEHSDPGRANGSVTTVDLGDKVLNGEPGDGLQSQKSSKGDDRGGKKSKATPKKIRLYYIANSLLLLFKKADACDVKVFAGSDNVTKFCLDFSCSTELISFPVTKGYEICIEDHTGERVSLKVSDIIWRVRYELKYYTSDYSSHVRTTEDCCISDEFKCYDVGNDCYGRRMSVLGIYKTSEEKIHHYCLLSSLKSCSSCVYLVETKRNGELYDVFKKAEETALIMFSIKGVHYSQNIMVSSYALRHYQFDLKNFKLKNIDSLPITVRSESTDLPPSNFLLRYKDKLYNVNASDYGQPFVIENKELTIDYQISLDKLSEVPVPSKFQYFEGEGCEKMRLTGSDENSMIRTFVRQLSIYDPSIRFLRRKTDHSVVDTFADSKKGKVTMQLGSMIVQDEELMAGKCDVEFLGSYGCSSCNESAYIVMEARNITKEGLIPFHSNCSFDEQSISCDYDPTKLMLKDNYSTCLIKMPTLNKHFLVDMTYFKFGHQIKHKEPINCTTAYVSYGEAIVNSTTSKTFILSYFVTLLLLIVFSLLVKIAFPLVCKPKVHYVVEKEEELVEL